MPRMSKKRKQEMSLYLSETGRIRHNDLCLKCTNACKLSFRAIVLECRRYHSKRAKEGDDAHDRLYSPGG